MILLERRRLMMDELPFIVPEYLGSTFKLGESKLYY